MFKLKSFILLPVFLLVTVFYAGNVMAESYQYEVNGTYINEKTDNTKTNSYMADAVFNFKEVNLDKVPWEEAAFLQKVGYVSINGLLADYKDDRNTVKLDYNRFGIDFGYVLPKVPFLVKLSYQRLKDDGSFMDSGVKYDLKDTKNTFSGELGYYIIDGLDVAASYEKRIKDDKTSINKDTKTDIYGANFKYVTMFSNEMGINIAGSYNYQTDKSTQPGRNDLKEKNKIYKIEGTFYVIPQIGLGCDGEFNRGDNKDDAGNTYSAWIKAYIIPNIGLSVGYSIFKPENTRDAEEKKMFMAALTGRI